MQRRQPQRTWRSLGLDSGTEARRRTPTRMGAQALRELPWQSRSPTFHKIVSESVHLSRFSSSEWDLREEYKSFSIEN